VIIYTSTELSKDEEKQLFKVTDNMSAKNITSKEQLPKEISIFLNQAQNTSPSQNIPLVREDKPVNEAMLKGKTVLIVDDDPRNIFAVSSALEEHGLKVLAAENGKDAIQMLHDVPTINAVLMDIMMPEMNGYQTTKEIRKHTKFKKLPIIALTAKAMIGDREKCLAAGTSDYISKPINMEHLLLVLSEHLNRETTPA
jgi:hypothetical protein